MLTSRPRSAVAQGFPQRRQDTEGLLGALAHVPLAEKSIRLANRRTYAAIGTAQLRAGSATFRSKEAHNRLRDFAYAAPISAGTGGVGGAEGSGPVLWMRARIFYPPFVVMDIKSWLEGRPVGGLLNIG